MQLERLKWLFGGLFLLFGAPLMVVEDPDLVRGCVGLAVLSLSAFAFAMAGAALQTGRIRLQFSVIHRAARPYLFWASVILVAAAGTGTLISAVWALFFKAW